jgi:hypothetical protein
LQATPDRIDAHAQAATATKQLSQFVQGRVGKFGDQFGQFE